MEKSLILDKQDFDTGKWLLIERNNITDSVRGITDEKVLKEYSKELIVLIGEDDKGTTCDGKLELYKDGRLVNSQEYLSDSRIFQPTDFEKFYHSCKMLSIRTFTEEIQKNTFDSLKTCKDSYPFFYEGQADDTSIVLYYKF